MQESQLAHQFNQQEYITNILKIFTLATTAEALKTPHNPESPAEDLWEEYDELLLPPTPEILPIGEPCGIKRVVACDTSTIKLAESSEGSFWALRGSIVVRDRNQRKAMLFGPFLYKLTPRNCPAILGKLYESLGCRMRSPQVSSFIAPKVIANLFERILQHHALSLLEDGILLLDGSLTAGPVDSPTTALRRLVDGATMSGCGVLAFSKSTRLVCMGRNILELARGHEPPYLLRPVLTPSTTGRYVVLGEVYVARLAPCSFPFRVDAVSPDGVDVRQVFQFLLSSDSLIYGYPESLALAHQIATFNRIDMMSLRASLESVTRSKISERPEIRAGLFAPIDV
ncbi:MAG: hypothetical protein QW756_07750 [Nitrososphaerota archaeon]